MATVECRKAAIQARMAKSSELRHELKLFVISLLLDFPGLSREEVRMACRNRGYGGGISDEAYMAARRELM